jgi:hypothetical protein
MSIKNIHQPYFLQQVEVDSSYANFSRMEIIPSACANKRVLHIGCVDYPITNVAQNLHLAVDKVAKHLVGVDTATESFDELRPHLRNKELYASLKDVPKQKFDLVLVPEVLEHVPNMAAFLEEIDEIDFSTLVISVPDAFSCARRHFELDADANSFYEAVHPDHNVWFSPYTLQNIIQKYTQWEIHTMMFVGQMSIMAICSKRPVNNFTNQQSSSDLGLNTLD